MFAPASVVNVLASFLAAPKLRLDYGDLLDHGLLSGQPGDYWMDVAALKAKLYWRTQLVLGDVSSTVASTSLLAPLGFIAFDLDYYSSTAAALRILHRRCLHRVALYFDDLGDHYNHQWAGEYLAIDEFNAESKTMKIDRWRGLKTDRPFPDAHWLDAMYLAHDLEAISAARLTRAPARMR